MVLRFSINLRSLCVMTSAWRMRRGMSVVSVQWRMVVHGGKGRHCYTVCGQFMRQYGFASRLIGPDIAHVAKDEMLDDWPL